MDCGIYCYIDKRNNEIVYIGKDSNIEYNKRHKAHLSNCNYRQQQINRVLQNNPDYYKYKVLKKWNKTKHHKELINLLERLYIKFYGNKYNYHDKLPKFNFTNGGDNVSVGKHHYNYNHELHKFEDEIIFLYKVKKYKPMTISVIFNCDVSTIRRILKNKGIELSNKNRKRTDILDKELVDLYVNKNLSIKELSEKFNCATETITRRLFKNKIYPYYP